MRAMRFAVVAAFLAVPASSAPVRALEPIPDRLVVLTFDDSAKSHFTSVRPLLKKHGFGATFFVTEGFDFKENKRDYMTWDEIEQLHKDGFEIGNHTRDHFTVSAGNVDKLREQLEAITVRCREHGIPDPVSFAYPGNGIAAEAFPILREAGIQWARRGGSPEYPYADGKGFAFEPGKDHPLLVPSAGDARPGWTLSNLRLAVDQAREGKIAVLQFHGAPDTAHQWVNLPPYKFEPFLNHLKARGCTVIALRDLAKYVDPDAAPADPMAVIEERREKLRAGATIVHPGDGAEMVYVPAGEFVMGIDAKDAEKIAADLGFESGEKVIQYSRRPAKTVALPGFFIDQNPVTVARWKRYVEAAKHRPEDPDSAKAFDDPSAQQHAAGSISWKEAREYAAWAGKSLPDDDQWEKAARGTDGRLYPWGNDRPTGEHGHFNLADAWGTASVPAGAFPSGASPYRALGMLGCAGEWTSESFTFRRKGENGQEEEVTVPNAVSMRGGGGMKGKSPIFAAFRMLTLKDDSHPALTFRTVWIPPKGYFDSDQFRRDTNAAENVASPLSDAERQTLESSLRQVSQVVAGLPDKLKPFAGDAAIFTKGVEWALRYDREFTRADRKLLDKALSRARERANGIAKGRTGWMAHRGKKIHGYLSAVDGSAQPYGLIVPTKYDQKTPIRLDVVLHGSTKPVGMSELRFMARFDEGDDGASFVNDVPYVELHPLGRVENCYRWAGETDVFEAIADVCRRYNIDHSRIVLRGMSMGASGTWHLGLKHPGFFAALGPYCGYVDTHKFSETPLPNFLRVGPLPEHQEATLHMLDSVDYAANASSIPTVACMGEKDIFFDAHVIMGEAFKKEGVPFVNLISPGTGHVIDPVTHAEQLMRIAEHLKERGRPSWATTNAPDGPREQSFGPASPRDLRFVTWTLKYNRSHWLQLLGLEKHYDRAEFEARRDKDVLEIKVLKNVTSFSIDSTGQPDPPLKSVRIDGTEFRMPGPRPEFDPLPLVMAREGDRWVSVPQRDAKPATGKRPGIQGPIDDAFTSPFLCVRPTGTAWNAAANDYAVAALDRFAEEWRHYFRGECPVKNDRDVTAEDFNTKNLILFGDPGSNAWIAKALPSLPLEWSKETLRFRGKEYSAKDHLPALIQPSPFPNVSHKPRYVVLNSGHTFRESELAKVNYLLFPRWGDWAVLKVDGGKPVASQSNPAPATLEEVIRAGFFDEDWK